MREVNFSSPHGNKASVGITAAIYDRRALDCTSTLPLINSLNSLAYLTTSSARIREILTMDGGLERLVCILKNGKSRDMMESWKWSLAFQCVVNIGVRGSESRATDVRGSENIRTRVVEADIVPVIATILDNYMQIMERIRARSDESEGRGVGSRFGISKRGNCPFQDRSRHSSGSRPDRRRANHQSLEIFPNNPITAAPMDFPSPANTVPANNPQEGPTEFAGQTPRHRHHQSQHLPGRNGQGVNNLRNGRRNLEIVVPPLGTASSGDALLVPPMTAGPQGEGASETDTPTTPTARQPQFSAPSPRRSTSPAMFARPFLPRESSNSGDSDEGDGGIPNDRARTPTMDEPFIGIQHDTDMEDVTDHPVLIDSAQTEPGLPAPEVTGDVSVDVDAETFNITHRSVDGSIVDPTATQANPPLGLSPVRPPFTMPEPVPDAAQTPRFHSLGQDRMSTPHVLAAVPRDEDVIMSLQLLAYVSKYCNLRSYFQQSHLVPKLKLGQDLQKLDGECVSETDVDQDNDAEYCLPNDYNIFPLIEKFTVKHHSQEMKYWAGVVMRNLCRKDKSRGDIRQCAYYKCGKWEEYTRQFAKCRRCRQTKYCSKDCQKLAWVAHRHWCEPAREGGHGPHVHTPGGHDHS